MFVPARICSNRSIYKYFISNLSIFPLSLRSSSGRGRKFRATRIRDVLLATNLYAYSLLHDRNYGSRKRLFAWYGQIYDFYRYLSYRRVFVPYCLGFDGFRGVSDYGNALSILSYFLDSNGRNIIHIRRYRKEKIYKQNFRRTKKYCCID